MRALPLLALAGLAAPQAALAQRAGENAVSSADDAFGSTVGLEQTGIYSEQDTRGFSPTKAGNGRIDGVYYDPVGALSARLRSGNAIRVGFAAEDYPFAAPTGIIEYRLRPFTTDTGISPAYNFMAFGGFIRELDVRLPLVRDKVTLMPGFAQSDLRQSDGASNRAWGFTVRTIARLGALEVAPFVSRATFTTNYAHPLAIVRDDYLPPMPKVRRYLGQDWARGRYHNNQMGIVVRGAVARDLSVRAGLFFAEADKQRNYSEIYTLLDPSGLASHRLIADPPQQLRSTSGEAQLAWRVTGGKWQHRFIAGFRARHRVTETGGSAVRGYQRPANDPLHFGEVDPQPEEDFVFTRPNRGQVRQSSLMLGYLGKLGDRLSINLGVQKARYRATLRNAATGLTDSSRADPWLYNATLGLRANEHLDFYAGTQRGLEDSGIAPESASNRNEQLPATLTRQFEAGLRWKLGRNQLVVSAFQIEKPYFSFDGTNLFSQIGQVRHRGVEASLNAHVGRRFNLLAGAVLMQPRVSSPLPEIGRRPTGAPSLYAKIDANYRTDIFGGLTPTASLTYTGRRAAGSRPLASLGGEQLMVAGYASVDLGLRQQFRIGKVPMSFRFVTHNAFDAASWRVAAPNAVYIDERRRFNLSIAADF